MRYILIFAVCLIGLNGLAQRQNTFFATKLSDDSKVKLVLVKGDKLKVKYDHLGKSHTIKGYINEIGLNHIIIENERIELAQLNKVSAHKPGIKVLGGILFASGSGLIVTGLVRKENPKTVTKASTGGKFTFTPEKNYSEGWNWTYSIWLYSLWYFYRWHYNPNLL